MGLANHTILFPFINDGRFCCDDLCADATAQRDVRHSAAVVTLVGIMMTLHQTR